MKIEFATTVSDRYRDEKRQNKFMDNDNFSVFHKFQTVIKQDHFFAEGWKGECSPSTKILSLS